MKHSLTVTHISTMAFDNQEVQAENEDVAIRVRLKNLSDHNTYAIGDKIDIELATKKTAKKTTSKGR